MYRDRLLNILEELCDENGIPADYSREEIENIDLINDLNFDSILLLEFVVRFEEEFDIQIEEKDFAIDKVRKLDFFGEEIRSKML